MDSETVGVLISPPPKEKHREIWIGVECDLCKVATGEKNRKHGDTIFNSVEANFQTGVKTDRRLNLVKHHGCLLILGKTARWPGPSLDLRLSHTSQQPG